MIDEQDLLFVPCDDTGKSIDDYDFLHIVNGSVLSFPYDMPYSECLLAEYYYIGSKKDYN